MIKMILTQIWNKRRSNAWLFVELLMVFCLLWYIVDYFFVLEYNKNIPESRSIDHTWQLTLNELPDTDPQYMAAQSDSAVKEANFDRILNRIRSYKGVMSIALIECGSPGAGDYWGFGLRNSSDTTKEFGGMAIRFDPRTDFFKTFHYTYPDGKAVEVKDFDWSDPKAIVIGWKAERELFGKQSAVGKQLEAKAWNGHPAEYYSVKGVVGDFKRFDYCRYENGLYMVNHVKDGVIAVRSSDNLSDTRFLQDFKAAMVKELRIGNYYLVGIKSYKEIAAETNTTFGMDNAYMVRTAMMLFFLVNIMLCVMGTFWYRIRVRREEIGLRMAMGSSRVGIRNLLFKEGVLLLTLVVLPAMFIEFQFVHAGMIDTLGKADKDMITYLPDRTALRFLITNAITWLILTVAIILAITVPADKAAKMAPADAMHYE
jgi:ABC-type antimicrobial peptide transport system, permease component